MEVQHLFPTPIFKFKIIENINDDLNGCIRGMKFRQTGLKQTVGNLHVQKEFEVFCNLALQNARKALDTWGLKYEDIQITNCWANVYSKNEAIQLHSHPNCFLSGVYYVKIPHGSSPIFFMDPRIPFMQRIVTNNAKITPYNSTIQWIPAEEGLMLLWPSWLQHYTQPHGDTRERVSISFNIMFKGRIGGEETLNALNL